MAKLSSINNNNKKKKIIESKKKSRDLLKKKIMEKDTSFEDRLLAVHKLAEMPRNSSRVRYRNRCFVSGRPRGVFRFFGMSRIAIREYASNGMLPGVTKSSW